MHQTRQNKQGAQARGSHGLTFVSFTVSNSLDELESMYFLKIKAKLKVFNEILAMLFFFQRLTLRPTAALLLLHEKIMFDLFIVPVAPKSLRRKS